MIGCHWFYVWQTYFEDNPRDHQLLRHDKDLHPAVIKPHLKNVPDYLGNNSSPFYWSVYMIQRHIDRQNTFPCPFQSRRRWKVSSILWNNGRKRRIKQAAWCWAALKWEYRSFMYLNRVLTQVISTYLYNNGTLVNSFGLNCGIFVFSVFILVKRSLAFYIYVYVCMYICMYVCVCIYIYIYIYISIYLTLMYIFLF